jgi:hypothetical protein
MAGLDPAIHAFTSHQRNSWMPATSAGMTDKFTYVARKRGKERRSMKKPMVKYSKGEIGRVRIVEDFLPSPDRLVLTDEQVGEVRRRRADRNRKLVSHAAARKRIGRLGS